MRRDRPGSIAREVAVAAVWRARSFAYVDRVPDPLASVVLLGSPRSGTTWIAEVIDRHHDHRTIFEPLRPGAVAQLAAFGDGQYLRPEDDDPRFVAPMRALLSGRIRNPWADHLNRVVIARRRLIKEIRGNLLAPWLLAQFPGLPVVMVLRHPLAVATSRSTLGWNEHLGSALAQPELVADHLAAIRSDLEAVTDPLQRQVAQWCIENVVPLRMTSPEELCVVTYEQLVEAPDAPVARVLASVGQRPDPELAPALERPSHLSRPDSAVNVGADRLSSWMSGLDPGDAERCDEILELFGLDGVYSGARSRPDLEALEELHRCSWPGS